MHKIKKLVHLRGRGYDYIIVGAGLAGTVWANRISYMTPKAKILIVEKRDHVGGNIYTEKWNGIDIHKYGSHIFHTNNETVWKFVNHFATFNNYKHRVMAATGNETVMLPFTMVTFMQLFNVQTVHKVKLIIDNEIVSYMIDNGFHKIKNWEPTNFEEQAIAIVGTTIYEKLIKHYTERQWGRDAKLLPAEIIKRLPLRMNTDTTYFNNAKYQGIPEHGYTNMIEQMLADCANLDILTCDFDKHQKEIMPCLVPGGTLIYTGALDELMNYKLGRLEYRSLEFMHTYFDRITNYQGTAVVNFTGLNTEYTRCTEHKHYSMDPNVLNSTNTVISLEKSVEHEPGKTIPYYPIGDKKNTDLHAEYVKLFKDQYPMGILAGRLADYKYYDMDKTIETVLESSRKFLMTKFNI